jgi:uncharacterized protein (DUF2147 family)
MRFGITELTLYPSVVTTANKSILTLNTWSSSIINWANGKIVSSNMTSQEM